MTGLHDRDLMRRLGHMEPSMKLIRKEQETNCQREPTQELHVRRNSQKVTIGLTLNFFFPN